MEGVTIGIDIVSVPRIQALIRNHNFLKKVFTQDEIVYCRKSSAQAAERFAVRFAAKEAIKKSLPELIEYNKIEIFNDRSGKPHVKFLDADIMKLYHTQISLSHTPEFAVASCLTYNYKHRNKDY